MFPPVKPNDTANFQKNEVGGPEIVLDSSNNLFITWQESWNTRNWRKAYKTNAGTTWSAFDASNGILLDGTTTNPYRIYSWAHTYAGVLNTFFPEVLAIGNNAAVSWVTKGPNDTYTPYGVVCFGMWPIQ
jgi:hypothetical protein